MDHRYVIVHTKYSHEVYAKRPQELYFFVLIGSEVYSIVTYLHSETYMMAIVTTRMRSSHKKLIGFSMNTCSDSAKQWHRNLYDM